MQCISTIAVVRRETGGWKWPIFQFTYMSVAYAALYRGARHSLAPTATVRPGRSSGVSA